MSEREKLLIGGKLKKALEEQVDLLSECSHKNKDNPTDLVAVTAALVSIANTLHILRYQ